MVINAVQIVLILLTKRAILRISTLAITRANGMTETLRENLKRQGMKRFYESSVGEDRQRGERKTRKENEFSSLLEKKRRRERTGDAIKNRTRANCNELESDLKNNREPELRKELEPQDPVFEGRELSLPSSRRFVGAGEAKGAGECAGGEGARARE